MIKDITDKLLDNKYISNISYRENYIYNKKKYPLFISCEILIKNDWVKIYIGVPNNWELRLFDFFIVDIDNFAQIPHLEKSGKMCLFDLEGVLIDTDICGLLEQSIFRAIELISDGISGINEDEFVEEFNSYWLYLNKIRFAKLVAPRDMEVQKIYFIEQNVKKNKKETKVEYNLKKAKASLFVAYDKSYFNEWGILGTIKKGVYLTIKSSINILPPNPRKNLEKDYINKLFKLAKAHAYMPIINEMGRDKLFIFEIKQPNDINVYLGVLLSDAKLEIDEQNNLSIKTYTSMYPIYVKRVDKQFLMSRIGTDVNPLTEKKYLLIGCGSIGGYLLNEMINSGCSDITLVDKDCLSEENIFRHLLGIEYVGIKKVEALCRYFKKNMIDLNLKTCQYSIEEAVYDGNIDLSEYDIIISAVGNHNVNRWINNKIKKSGIDVPVIYTWNEPLDVGCHVAYINNKNKGCYECFFSRDLETHELYDNTSFTQRGQKVSKNLFGCGGSFIPYGSQVSLNTTLLAMNLLKKIVEERCNENLLISQKGEAYYFNKAGLKTSNNFNLQEEIIKKIEGKDFVNKSCKFCGTINGV